MAKHKSGAMAKLGPGAMAKLDEAERRHATPHVRAQATGAIGAAHADRPGNHTYLGPAEQDLTEAFAPSPRIPAPRGISGGRWR